MKFQMTQRIPRFSRIHSPTLRATLGGLVLACVTLACGLTAPSPTPTVAVIVPSSPPPTAAPSATPTLIPSPTVTVEGPLSTPTLAPPKLSNKPPDGPTSNAIGIEAVFDPLYLMQIQTRIKGTPNNGDGIEIVYFTVERGGQVVYTQSETLAAYCIFKGGEPDCNPWPQSNGRLTWGPGGPVVETGDYKATIRVASKTDPNHPVTWTIDFTIDLP